MTSSEELEIAKKIAKRTDILTLLGNINLAGHGEMYGPCPFCGGKDRFHVKPADNIWFCRQCTGDPHAAGWNDQIELYKRLHNLTYVEALRNLAPSAFGGQPSSPRPPRPTLAFPPRGGNANIPPAEWQAKAFEAACTLADDIWRPENERARQWLNKRGIDDAAIYRYNIGFINNSHVNGIEFKLGRGIVIPHWSQQYRIMFGLKIRRPLGEPKYYCATGSKPASSLYNADSLSGHSICFITEGELDTLALHSQISDLAAVVTLGSKNARLTDAWLADLYHIKRFIIVTDCGEDEAAANYWLSLVGKRGRRITLPNGYKDICAAAEGGLNLRDWTKGVIG